MNRKLKILLVVLPLAVLAWSFVFYIKPLPIIKPSVEPLSLATQPPVALPWPAGSQAALGAVGFGLLNSYGEQKSVPIASVAKVVTALAVLNQKPLGLNQQGPTLTLTSKDVDIFNNYYSQGGSVAKIQAGEQISEYQALQALLLPSANNFADSLVNWAFGSMDDFLTYANRLVKNYGLIQTHIGDASGFSPATTSTSNDLVALGEKALANPVLAQIVAQKQADIPVAGTVRNVNWLLGDNGIIGIKTGDTDQAGGCYLFAATHTIEGQKITLIGAILGAPSLTGAINGSIQVLTSVDNGFQKITAIRAGQAVGKYQTPWNVSLTAIAKQDITMLAWRGTSVSFDNKLNNLQPPVSKDTVIGNLNVSAGGQSASSPVILQKNLSSPPLSWRLFKRL